MEARSEATEATRGEASLIANSLHQQQSPSINRYYKSPALVSQANAIIAMICISMFVQLVWVSIDYSKKRTREKVREALICLLFLRPAVDIYRVSTNHKDDEIATDPLTTMIVNKSGELAMDSIPSCVLQCYVWLNNTDEGEEERRVMNSDERTTRSGATIIERFVACFFCFLFFCFFQFHHF